MCNKEVVTDAIECSLCVKWIHRKCAKLSKKKIQIFSDEGQYRYCICSVTFPVSDVDEDEFQLLFMDENMNRSKLDIYKKCYDIDYDFLKYDEHVRSDNQCNVDPVNDFYSGISSDCHYFTDNNFSTKFENMEGFFIIHFNCRSLKSCFSDLKHYLLDLKKTFDVICISESWLTNNDDLVEYSLDSYEVVVANRVNTRGGGVIIYVSNLLNFKVVDKKTECVDDLYECVTVEIDVKNNRNIVVSCLYRTPASCVETFVEHIEQLINTVKNTKLFSLVGDFNINLLKYESHTGT